VLGSTYGALKPGQLAMAAHRLHHA